MAEPSAIPRQIAFWFYTLLLAAGIAFYLAWGLWYGSWNIFEPRNAGVYAVTAILVGFGVVGVFLYRRPQ